MEPHRHTTEGAAPSRDEHTGHGDMGHGQMSHGDMDHGDMSAPSSGAPAAGAAESDAEQPPMPGEPSAAAGFGTQVPSAVICGAPA